MGGEGDNGGRMTVTRMKVMLPRGGPRRFSFDSIPVEKLEPLTEMASPPLQRPGSIPFRWEEAPGKPKKQLNQRPPPASRAKSLTPPPRATSSSTTAGVSSGLRRPTSRYQYSLPLGQGGQPLKTAVEKAKVGEGRNKERSVSPWRRMKRGRKGVSPVSSPFSSPSRMLPSSRYVECVTRRGEREEGTTVRITALRRSVSFSSHPTPSHWLANIYGNIKQVVRRKMEGAREIM